ncbi:cytochrome P450 [Whalleya microplaca]|nr:cytochrome P450 [Whalleya microplaca]
MAVAEIIHSAVLSFSSRYCLILALVVFLLPIFYYACFFIYNLYFHPLSKYPGPRLAAATSWWIAFSYARGTGPADYLKLHNQYGPVVRTSPNELSFINQPQWKEIYGHRPSGAPEFTKDKKYHSGMKVDNILNSDRQHHIHLRKSLAHGFSDKALREQEPVLQQYVSLLIQKLHENSQDGTIPVDLVSRYNFLTFDFIGFLTYGESFDCLNGSQMHTWVGLFFAVLKIIALNQAISRLPRLLQAPAKLSVIPRSVKSDNETMSQLNTAKTKHRLETKSTIPDFMDKLIDTYESGKISFEQLTSNASILIGAGSETTATLLSGLTFLLFQHPIVLEKLTMEIRGNFQSRDDITITGVNNCKYLLACIEEALRVYPPSPQPHHRVIPLGGAMVNGEFLPEGAIVSIPIYASSNSPVNWFEPEKFIPERWMGEDAKFEGDKRETSQPFSYGPRNCIGRNLAYVEMKIVMATILWHFDMENATEGDWLDQKVYLVWEKSPLWVKLHPVRRS